MKKLLLFMFLLSLKTYSQFSESFEAAVTAPVGWTVINGGAVNTWVGTDLINSTGLQAQNGTKCFSITFNATAHDDYLVTPQFVVTTGTTDRLTFWARSRDVSYPETIAVKVSTTTATAAAFTTTLVATIAPSSGANFVKYELSLATLVNQNVFIGFHSTTTDQFVFDLDNVVVGTVASCVEPLSPPTATTTETTANVSWTAASPVPASGYDILYSTSGVAPTNASVPSGSVGAGVTNFNISGLTGLTKYYVYIRSKCSASINSPWGHLGVINTFVDPIPLPYATGFDSPANQAGWTLSGNNLGSMGYGNNAAFAQAGAGYWIFNTTAAPATANNNYFYSRPISLAANESVTFSFWYRTPIVRNLRVTVGNANNQIAQSTVVYSNATLPIATSFAQITAPTFVAPAAGTYYFAFNDLSAPAPTSTLRIDTVSITSVLLSTASFKKNVMSVYPNPTKNLLNIESISNSNISHINISDINGRVVKEYKNVNSSNIQINISDIASGMYIMNINSDLGTIIKKIVKE